MAALDVPQAFRRGGRKSHQEWLDSGCALVELMAAEAGRSDLSTLSVLDIGCGTKLVAAIVEQGLPVGRYTGIDIDGALIAWLNAALDEPRFAFAEVPARNARYAPDGSPLPSLERLPVDGPFDLISMWSVLTHVTPDDAAFLLGAARAVASPDGLLLASVFLPEPSEGGHGIYDSMRRWFDRATFDEQGFADLNPRSPLKWAVFRRDAIVEIAVAAGWKVEAIRPPSPVAQHVLVLRPA
ncbi:MAG: class I SAM-dependent methyltransferase [Acidimicrobiia bacterium]|nr:class I SAM-dependent methyltransferase [Acidimicrobiia bacterium]